MDKRHLSEKIFDRISAYWTGFCIGWSVFDNPGGWRLVAIFLVVLLGISALDLLIFYLRK